MNTAAPPGFQSVLPHLGARDAAAALDWYNRVFGIEELARFPHPDGTGVFHAQFRVGDCVLMLTEKSILPGWCVAGDDATARAGLIAIREGTPARRVA